jgi:hypothetical protein
MANRLCKTCEYWHDTNTSSGFCRQLPPKRPDNSLFGVWPITKHDDWCGEWKLSEEEDEARSERSAQAAMEEEREMAAAEGRPAASWARMEH